MIWFILAIAFSSMIVVTFKLFDRFKVDSIQAITLNYIIALLIGSQTLGMAGLNEFVTTRHTWVPFAILNGFLFIVVLLSFAASTKAVGIAITSVSSKTSVVLPVSMGFLLLHEGFGYLKMLGIVVALVAIYLRGLLKIHFLRLAQA